MFNILSMLLHFYSTNNYPFYYYLEYRHKFQYLYLRNNFRHMKHMWINLDIHHIHKFQLDSGCILIYLLINNNLFNKQDIHFYLMYINNRIQLQFFINIYYHSKKDNIHHHIQCTIVYNQIIEQYQMKQLYAFFCSMQQGGLMNIFKYFHYFIIMYLIHNYYMKYAKFH